MAFLKGGLAAQIDGTKRHFKETGGWEMIWCIKFSLSKHEGPSLEYQCPYKNLDVVAKLRWRARRKGPSVNL